MPIKSVYILVLALFLGMSSCLVWTKKGMQSWVGYSEHDVKLIWGPAYSESSDGAGGKILHYVTKTSKNYYATSNTDNYGVTRTQINSTGGHTHFWDFYLNKDGEVYSWRSRDEGLMFKSFTKLDNSPRIIIKR